MKKILIRIEQTTSLEIFDEPQIKQKTNELFDNLTPNFKKKFNEIMEFLNLNSSIKISYDTILSEFKISFYKTILNQAVKNALQGHLNYSISANVLDLLTESNLQESIENQLMIQTFSKTLRKMAPLSGFSSITYNKKITDLEKKYLFSCKI